MNEDSIMLCERMIAICKKIERFYIEPDPQEPDPIKVLGLIVDDAISVRNDAEMLLAGRPISEQD